MAKCCICGKSPRKNYIKAPKKTALHYFCIECYKQSKWYIDEDDFEHWLKLTQEEIEQKKSERVFKSQSQKELSIKEKSELIDYLKGKYAFIDSRFYSKKCQINSGKFGTKQYPKSLVSFSISDTELLEIFIQMEDYLKKQVANVDNNGKLHYALAIVYNSYPKYLQWKKDKMNNKVEQEVETVQHIQIKECKKDICYDDFLF
jgi:hypothetical protein